MVALVKLGQGVSSSKEGLLHDIQEDEDGRRYARKKLKRGNGRERGIVRDDNNGKNEDDHEDDEDEDGMIDPRSSRRITTLAQKQQDEIAEEEARDEPSASAITSTSAKARAVADSDSEEDEAFDWDDEEEKLPAKPAQGIDPSDMELLDRLHPAENRDRRTLADLISEKLAETEGEKHSVRADGRPKLTLSPKAIEVYEKVGHLLHRFKSGKLPKAFKIIPSLPQWEQVLYITQPEEWTVHAMYEATRIFASNLKIKQTQKFYTFVLLERVREDILQHKRLNYHLYMALKKALYKPAAFFKGVLFPLCDSGTCTLKEAAILASILQRVSIPALHSSAALLRLANMEYTGPNSLFIRVLVDKKYALPFRVLDGLVFHFLRFKKEKKMPVLWHQSLLVFSQRYKSDLTSEQKEALFDLLRHQSHPSITPEIRRELAHAIARDDEMQLERSAQVPATAQAAIEAAMLRGEEGGVSTQKGAEEES